MAKAVLRKAENEVDAMWLLLGQCLDRVRQLSGLSLKQFADRLGRNERQVARWFEGKERPQFDAVWAVVEFRQPLVIVLARVIGAGVKVTTQIVVE